ncbi:MAG: SCP2 sterol-binding domain-containing protein [Sandaracinus sp.]|nr:SCP2 sterol-binding domain-containing protein [Sandaracinus sp.]MCB9611649.1 SCP2 sterol-binding domain-containing protein [Sandaracinus sp.]MCB9618863.1 SCP2 sterol-binding domain-containing protein [Sandaracinus sp.]MCB9625471.1 SCP2 sterol-binding domain-containing protein [Sandaracinus sp.]MCB9633835.1 SCP2 sterol-binding domain-containing protein [Sandaracinus sp.]
MEPSIHLAPRAEDNGYAVMVAQLLRQGLDERPEKKATVAKMHGRVTLVVTDLGLTVSLVFDGGRVTVHDGFAGIPDVTVRAPAEWHTKMSLVELEPRFGLPDPRGPVAKEVFEASKRGEIQMHGMWASLPLVFRMTKVLSVA